MSTTDSLGYMFRAHKDVFAGIHQCKVVLQILLEYCYGIECWSLQNIPKNCSPTILKMRITKLEAMYQTIYSIGNQLDRNQHCIPHCLLQSGHTHLRWYAHAHQNHNWVFCQCCKHPSCSTLATHLIIS